MSESEKHKHLKDAAIRWLRRTGCIVFAQEMRFWWLIVDAAGMKSNGDVYWLEAKVSQSDLVADGKRGKMWKLKHEGFLQQRCSFIYYILADGVDWSVLPRFIGVIDETCHVVRRAERMYRPSPLDYKRKADMYAKFARCLSWRTYGHLIYGE